MSNDYLTIADEDRLVRETTARAERLNDDFDAVVSAFDKLPDLDELMQGRITYATEHASSAANVYVFTLPHPFDSYTEGVFIVCKSAHGNTGASTVNFYDANDALLGAKALRRPDDSALVQDDIAPDGINIIVYDGSKFQVVSWLGSLVTAVTQAAASEAAAAASAASAAASQAAASASETAAALSATSAASSAAAAQHVYAGLLDGSSPNHQTSSATLSAGVAGITFDFIAGATNTNAMLLDIGATTNIALKDLDGTALPAGAVILGRHYAGCFTAAAVARIKEVDASQTTAEAGTDTVAKMTALRVAQYVTARIASQGTATTGADNTSLMTALRTLQSIQANGILQGLHTVDLEGRALTPRTTNGPVASSSESSSNKVMIAGLSYDQTTSQGAQGRFVMPKSWNGGTITCRARWTAASGSGTVIWGFRAVALRDNVVLDSAFGTAQTVTDTLLTASYEHVSPTSAAITIAGSPVAQDTIILEVYRDIADTLNASAILLSVEVFITLNAGNDA